MAAKLIPNIFAYGVTAEQLQMTERQVRYWTDRAMQYSSHTNNVYSFLEEQLCHTEGVSVDDVFSRIIMLYANETFPAGENPYHNFRHAAVVAMETLDMLQVTGGSERDMRIGFLAGIMHDAGHSGGATSDTRNVARAISLLETSFEGIDSPLFAQDVIEDAADAIFSTAFADGSFVVAPRGNVAQCLRDADLLMFRQPDFIKYLCGLRVETKKPITYAGNLRWLREQQFFIEDLQPELEGLLNL